jgi:hypothetical protein
MKKPSICITYSLFLLLTCVAAMVLPPTLARADEEDPAPLCGGVQAPGPPTTPSPCAEKPDSCTPNPPPNPNWTFSCCRSGSAGRCIKVEWRYQCCSGDPDFWGYAWREIVLGVETSCIGTQCLEEEPPGGGGGGN